MSKTESQKGAVPIQTFTVIGLMAIIIALVGGILFFNQIKSFFKNPSVPGSIKTSQSVAEPTLNPKVTCAKFTDLNYALKYIDQACILDLSRKNLKTLPPGITSLTHLNTIILNKNKFTVFPEELLSLRSIVEIDLANNQIKEIPLGISNLKRLQVLDLSNNKITKLPEDSKYLNSIPSLNLIGNDIDKADKSRVHAVYQLLPLDYKPASPTSSLK